MNKDIYIERSDTKKKKEPVAKAFTCLAFGAVSLLLGDIVGLVLGIIAERLALAISAEFPKTKTARLAAVGGAMGAVGAFLSVATLLLVCVLAVMLIWVFAGGSIFGIPLA